MEQKVCLYSGERFTPKKGSQRFANNLNRIKFYNERATALRLARSIIDKPLHDNHRILMRLMGNKREKEFTKQYLLGAGFDFSVHTHVDTYKDVRAFGIYNFIIVGMQNDQVKIIQNDGTRANR